MAINDKIPKHIKKYGELIKEINNLLFLLNFIINRFINCGIFVKKICLNLIVRNNL